MHPLNNADEPARRTARARGRRSAQTLVASLVLLMSCTDSPVHANATGAKKLRGITQLGVVVESCGPSLTASGINSTVLKTDTELALRAFNIPVCSPLKGNFIYIDVHSLPINDGDQIAYCVEVSVASSVIRKPDYFISSALVWHTAVNDRVRELINDFLSVNPRPLNEPAAK